MFPISFFIAIVMPAASWSLTCGMQMKASHSMISRQLLVDLVVVMDAIVLRAVDLLLRHCRGDVHVLVHRDFGRGEQRRLRSLDSLLGAADVEGQLPVIQCVVDAGDLRGARALAELDDGAKNV